MSSKSHSFLSSLLDGAVSGQDFLEDYQARIAASSGELFRLSFMGSKDVFWEFSGIVVRVGLWTHIHVNPSL